MLHQTFLFLGQLLQLFEVSQILEFLRYAAWKNGYAESESWFMSCLISLLHILHPLSFATLSSLHLSDSNETLMEPQNSYFGQGLSVMSVQITPTFLVLIHGD